MCLLYLSTWTWGFLFPRGAIGSPVWSTSKQRSLCFSLCKYDGLVCHHALLHCPRVVFYLWNICYSPCKHKNKELQGLYNQWVSGSEVGGRRRELSRQIYITCDSYLIKTLMTRWMRIALIVYVFCTFILKYWICFIWLSFMRRVEDWKKV